MCGMEYTPEPAIRPDGQPEIPSGSGQKYRGYVLWRVRLRQESMEDPWRAYGEHSGDAWFSGSSYEDLTGKIDSAFAELPEPVY
jgi:hypothetical protein